MVARDTFPEQVAEALGEAQRAWEAGDHRRVRELLALLLVHAQDDETARAVRGLRARVALDPWVGAILFACALALAAVTYVYVLS